MPPATTTITTTTTAATTTITAATLILPAARVPRPLALDVATLRAALPNLPAASRIALWRLPAHIALVAALALVDAGYTAVWLNDRWRPAEARAALAPLHPRLILLPAALRATADYRALGATVPPLFFCRDSAGDIATSPAPRPSVAPPTPPPPRRHAGQFRSEAAAAAPPSIFFTSGTTSAPKPVLLSHAAQHAQARAKLAVLPLAPSAVYLHLSPLHHVGGMSSALAATLAGAAHVFAPLAQRPTARGAACELLRLVRRRGVDVLVVVPAVLRVLVDAAGEAVVGCVACILYGGGRLEGGLRGEAARVFPNARLVGAYGMTETASSMTFLDHGSVRGDLRLHQSAGWAPPHVQLAVRQVEGIEDRRGRVGEIVTRGVHVMEGYIGERGDLEGVDAEGWIRTGDLGYVDERSGALYLVGRRKDMIKSGGENVFAREVEEALVGCEDVREAAVVGIPHRVLGEAVAAAVVLAEGVGGLRGEILREVREACRQALSPFKRPRWIVEREELPRNATGKVLKDIVREQLKDQLTVRRAML